MADEAPKPKATAISTQFFYFGASLFFRTSIDKPLRNTTVISLDDTQLSREGKFIAMKAAIDEDMDGLVRTGVGKSVPWKANGEFRRLDDACTHIFILYIHIPVMQQ